MFYNEDNRNYVMSDLCSLLYLNFLYLNTFYSSPLFHLVIYYKQNLHVILHTVRKN